MKKYIFLLFVIFTLQSCHYPVKKDYGIYSKSLVFSKDQKWLINTIYTNVGSDQREVMNKEVLQVFNKLSDGSAYTLNMAKSQNIIQNRIPFEPENEDLETLKNSTDFNFLVNISTIKVRKDLDSSLGQQPEYKKNETFAIMDVYDIHNMKKIYSFKASSEFSVEKGDKATIFTPTSGMMTMKNFRQLLKSIKKNAVKN